MPGGAQGTTVYVIERGLYSPSSNLNESVCISHSTNTPRKEMNPTPPAPVMGT